MEFQFNNLTITRKSWILILAYERYNIATSEPDNVYSPSQFQRNTHQVLLRYWLNWGSLVYSLAYIELMGQKKNQKINFLLTKSSSFPTNHIPMSWCSILQALCGIEVPRYSPVKALSGRHWSWYYPVGKKCCG